MRFLVAVGVFILSAVFIMLGIAQRTVWLGPDSVELEAEVPKQAAVMVIDSDVLNSFPNRQRLLVSAQGQIVAVTGRSTDIAAWLDDVEYSTLHYNERTETLSTRIVAGENSEVVHPIVGSDLWFDEYTAPQNLRFAVDIPNDYSLLVTTEEGIPGQLDSINLSLSLDNSTPWAGPAFLIGGILVFSGVIILIWAVHHHRKKRGPRRKNPNEPKNTKSLVRGLKKSAITQAPQKGRRKATKSLTMGAALTASVLLITGCSPAYWPQFPDPITEETMKVEATEPAPELELIQPSLTVLQFEKVISRIAGTISEADENLDAGLAAERVGQGALQTREVAYKLAAGDSNQALPAGVDPASIQLFLPQQTVGWPRSFLTVTDVASGESAYPQLQYFTQATPHENYKLVYQVNLVQDLPEVAAAAQGSATVPSDSKLLPIQKSDAVELYADILLNGDAADPEEIFSAENDVLREQYGKAYKDSRSDDMPRYSEIAFSSRVSDTPIVGFWTQNSGAILLGSIIETETVSPTETGATVSTSGKAKTLLGKDKTDKGIVVTYLQQVLIYVPPITETDAQLKLIGYSQDLLSATEK